MNRKILVILPACVFVLFAPASRAEAPEARAILEKTLARDYTDMVMNIHLVKVSKSGRERPMDLEVKMKKTPEVTKTLAVFTGPPEVKGISSLVWDYADAERKSDRWFKLTGLDYVKCMGKSCRRMEERFGFSMDIFAIELDDAAHEFLGIEELDGAPCYKVASAARGEGITAGSRFVTWVDKEKYAARKIEAYDENGEVANLSRFTEFKLLGDHWWETKGELEQPREGKQLRFEIVDARVDVELDDELFEPPRIFKVSKDE